MKFMIRIILSALLMVSGSTYSQWVPHGPGPNTLGQVENITDREVVGAIHAVAAHPTDADIVYVGGVNSGIWMTTNALAASPSWQRQIDGQQSLSIGALAFDPTDAGGQTLLAGIGRSSSLGGRGSARSGILRTTDGGANWTPITAAVTGLNISGVAPRGATLVISANAADGGVNSTGIWRSIDTGASWTRVSGAVGSGLPAGASFDLAADPSNTAILYTNAGTAGIYRSVDTGATWSKVSDAAIDALLGFTTGNIEISVGSNNNVYAGIVNSGQLAGLFRSGDGGANWTSLDLPLIAETSGAAFGIHPGTQGATHFSIAADLMDNNVVYIGGDRQPHANENPASPANPVVFPNALTANDFSGRLFRVDASLATGTQASPLTHGGTGSNSSPHADSRDMVMDVNGDILEVDDGGIYRQTDPLVNTGDWLSMNGDIQTTELYAIAWDANAKMIISGAQDTGTPQEVFSGNPRWSSVATADGGDVTVDDISTPGLSVRYSSSQFLSNIRRRVYNSSNVLQSEVLPIPLAVTAPVPALQPQFVTPIKINAVNGLRLVLGANNGVYESFDQGDNVTQISNIRVNSGGGMDPIAYGAGGNAEALYVGVNAAVFVRTAAAPAVLTQSAAYNGGFVTDIVLDPGDAQTAFVIGNNDVLMTTNAGGSWTTVTGNLAALTPGTLWSLAYSTSNAEGSIIAGADNGVYIAPGPNFNVWSELGNNLPNAAVTDLEYDTADEILAAATLGRGAWSYSLKERDPVSLMLVLDISGSMNSEACTTCEPKLEVLKDAVEIFTQLWSTVAISDDKMGVTYFRTNINEFSSGGTVLLPVLGNSDAIIADIRSQTTTSADLTAMGGGLQSALNRLGAETGLRNILVFTDGMQNVNPMVQDSDLDIEDQADITSDSNINPTVPPTRLDSDLGIKVNTIGVGATDPFVDLLDEIAGGTGGLTKLTTAPDDELRRFYVEELIDALRDFSPQLVEYEYGTTSSQVTKRSFEISGGARKVIFKLSWKSGQDLSFDVVKDDKNLIEHGQRINGEFYRIFAIDMPANVDGTIIESGGNWTVQIYGAAGVDYELAVLVDEPMLEYTFSLGDKDYVVGDSLELTVNLSYGGLPLTDAGEVKAIVRRPGESVGTLLATMPEPVEPPGFQMEAQASPGQRKYALLQQNPEFVNRLLPLSNNLTFTNNGNGSYTALFPFTDVCGSYTVDFTISGTHANMGNYERREMQSVMVRFDAAVFNASDVRIVNLPGSPPAGGSFIHLRPVDANGNYLGPDYGSQISVVVSDGTAGPDKRDLADGGYLIPIDIPAGSDPVVIITVMDKPLYEGPLSELDRRSYEYIAFSLHGGVTLPIGNLNTIADPYWLAELDVEWRINRYLALEGVAGRYNFKPAISVNGGTAYLKGYLPLGAVQPYGAFGAGLYNPDNAGVSFGISAGAGAGWSITPRLIGDAGAYYFGVFPNSGDIHYLGLKAGVKLRL